MFSLDLARARADDLERRAARARQVPNRPPGGLRRLMGFRRGRC